LKIISPIYSATFVEIPISRIRLIITPIETHQQHQRQKTTNISQRPTTNKTLHAQFRSIFTLRYININININTAHKTIRKHFTRTLKDISIFNNDAVHTSHEEAEKHRFD